MANEFPRKTLPQAVVDPDSLARHVQASDPHPGVYIKEKDNTLGLGFVTIFRTYTQFRTIPENKGGSYSPNLVFYTGVNVTDNVTGQEYKQMHPYVYNGRNKAVEGVLYPVWEDKVADISSITETVVQELIYQHATDADRSINVHPTLARASHSHGTGEVTGFDDRVFDLGKGWFAFKCADYETAKQRRFDGALIIYTNSNPTEYKPGYYLRMGRMYIWDDANQLWTDVTANGEAYTKEEIDSFILVHNANVSPFEHSFAASAIHTHEVKDITDYTEDALYKINSKIGVHDSENSEAHSALFSKVYSTVTSEVTRLDAAILTEARVRQREDDTLSTMVVNTSSALQSNIDSTSAVLQSNLNEEARVRSNADSALSSALDVEAQTRYTSDGIIYTSLVTASSQLRDDLNVEAQTRSDVDSGLNVYITNVSSALASSLADEAAIRSQTDTALNTSITTASSALNERITVVSTTLHSDIVAEAKIRSDNDIVLDSRITTVSGVLQNAITSEAQTRSSADALLRQDLETASNVLNTRITTVSGALHDADVTLQTNITNEATTRATNDKSEQDARIAGDNTLQANIDAEASTRATNDTNEATTRATADTNLQTAVNNEATARISKDNELAASITSVSNVALKYPNYAAAYTLGTCSAQSAANGSAPANGYLLFCTKEHSGDDKDDYSGYIRIGGVDVGLLGTGNHDGASGATDNVMYPVKSGTSWYIYCAYGCNCTIKFIPLS